MPVADTKALDLPKDKNLTDVATPHDHKHPWLVWLLVAIAAVTLARIAILIASDINLGGDEAQYWSWAQKLDWGYFSKPPMVAYLIAASTAVCGDGEACVRLPSPLLHGATSVVLFFIAKHLGGARLGFWAGLTYLTLPAVSFSSQLVSTDIALLLCWSMALLAYLRLLDGGGRHWFVILGVSLGFGLLSKYAMAYFFLGIAVHMTLQPAARPLLRQPGLWAALILAIMIIIPNLMWNQTHSWATVGHLGANANLGGGLFQPLNALRFVGEQFGVIGPIIAVAFGFAIVRRKPFKNLYRHDLLLAFSVPILVVIMGQAFLSRANANWAATAYPAATILATMVLLERGPALWRRLSFGLHVAVMLTLWALLAGYPSLRPPGDRDPLARLYGWPDFAAEVTVRLANHPNHQLLLDDRKVMASLLYYLRDDATTAAFLMWNYDDFTHHHYELTRDYADTPTDQVLLIARWGDPAVATITRNFDTFQRLADLLPPEQAGVHKPLQVYLLNGYRGNKASDNAS